ncbi:MAG: hypothetical protein KDI69_08270, partial [Xanthomonadales bacterium]|nr:hypothetical protein [Xanthomonadales bacterium]
MCRWRIGPRWSSLSEFAQQPGEQGHRITACPAQVRIVFRQLQKVCAGATGGGALKGHEVRTEQEVLQYALGELSLRFWLAAMLDVQIGITMIPGLRGRRRVEQHGGTFEHHVHIGVVNQKIKDLLDVASILLKNDASASHRILRRRGIATYRITDLEFGLLLQLIPGRCRQQHTTDTEPPILAANIDA